MLVKRPAKRMVRDATKLLVKTGFCLTGVSDTKSRAGDFPNRQFKNSVSAVATSVPAVTLQAGDASGTGLFDTANRTYDSKRLGSIDSGLEDKFPQLIGPNEVRPTTECSASC